MFIYPETEISKSLSIIRQRTGWGCRYKLLVLNIAVFISFASLRKQQTDIHCFGKYIDAASRTGHRAARGIVRLRSWSSAARGYHRDGGSSSRYTSGSPGHRPADAGLQG